MFDGVGRRRDQSSGQLTDLGAHSLNGNERNCLFRNNGDGTFTDTGYLNQADRSEDGRGVSIFDYDQDGQLDVLLRNYNQPAQLLHNIGGPGHWIELKLIGRRSNRDAVGARVTLWAGGQRQTREVHAGSAYLSGSSLVQHFGLGAQTHVDSITVRWPCGTESTFADFGADQEFVLREGEAQAVAVNNWAEVSSRLAPAAARAESGNQ